MTIFRGFADEFQARRRTAERLQRPWILLLLAGWVGVAVFFYAENFSNWAIGLFVASIVSLGLSAVRINFITMKHYRCPSCGAIPKQHGMRGGVFVNPWECPSCGVALR
jgi:hypothetical protein